MIFYFTGTGNSKYVAERIAEAIGDTVRPIEDCSQVLHLKDAYVACIIVPSLPFSMATARPSSMVSTATLTQMSEEI